MTWPAHRHTSASAAPHPSCAHRACSMRFVRSDSASSLCTSSHFLAFEGELAARGHRLPSALPVTLTGNQLVHHHQTLGLQGLQSPQYLVAPAFVLSIAAGTGRLEAAVASSELSQQFAFECARVCRG